MFDASPSPDFLRRFNMAQGQNPMPYMGGGGGMNMPPGSVPNMNPAMPGNMPPNPQMMPMDRFGGMGGYQPLQIGPSGMRGMGIKEGPQQQVQKKPQTVKPNKMATDRPGFWGKYNSIAQNIQPMAMDYLMRS